MTRLTFPPSHRYWSPLELRASATFTCFTLRFFFLDGATICPELYTRDTYIFCVHVCACALVNMALVGAEYVFKQQNGDILDGPGYEVMVPVRLYKRMENQLKSM